jgi:hypothetical protein
LPILSKTKTKNSETLSQILPQPIAQKSPHKKKFKFCFLTKMQNSEPISPAFNSNNEDWAMDESMIQNRIKNIYQKIADYSEAKNSAMKFTPIKSSLHKKENANPLDDSILDSGNGNGNFANKMLDFGQGSAGKRPESTIGDLESKVS